MPVTNPKLFTYLGFCIRKGALVRGVNAIQACRKPIYLLLLCSSASPNTVKEAESIALRRGLPLFTVDDLEGLVQKQNCRLAAVTDQKLGEAALAALQEQN